MPPKSIREWQLDTARMLKIERMRERGAPTAVLNAKRFAFSILVNGASYKNSYQRSKKEAREEDSHG